LIDTGYVVLAENREAMLAFAADASPRYREFASAASIQPDDDSERQFLQESAGDLPSPLPPGSRNGVTTAGRRDSQKA
jgi:hypothetical protein